MSLETLTTPPQDEDLYPFTDWAELYRNFETMRNNLLDELILHLGELEMGTYRGRRISASTAAKLAEECREDIGLLESVDINDKDAILREMRMYQKRNNVDISL